MDALPQAAPPVEAPQPAEVRVPSTELSTKERLARRLESIGASGLAKHASDGLYSDFESEVATPKVLLVADLTSLARHASDRQGYLGLHAMAREVRDGKNTQTGEMRELIDKL